MRARTRRIAWILAVFAVVFFLACAFLPACFCCHTCSGSHCPICVQISAWHAVQRSLLVGALCVFAFAAVRLLTLSRPCAVRVRMRCTLITWKTKLIN